MMIRAEVEDPEELVELKVRVPREVKRVLLARKRLKGVTFSESAREAFELWWEWFQAQEGSA